METKRNLPALNDLYADQELAVKTNDLNILLSHQPADAWVKVHPVYKNKYLSIERLEWLLTTIFLKWWVEILDSKLLGNSIAVTVRLNVIDPVTGEKMFQEGIGAAPLQTDSGAGAIEFNKLKTNAVMIAAPAAETEAIKDAAHKFGRLFGKDLNRKEVVSFDNLEKKFPEVDNFENESN